MSTSITITPPNGKPIRLESDGNSADEVLSTLADCLRKGVRLGLEFTHEAQAKRRTNKNHHMHRVWLERGAGMRSWPRKVKSEVRQKWVQEAKKAGLVQVSAE